MAHLIADQLVYTLCIMLWAHDVSECTKCYASASIPNCAHLYTLKLYALGSEVS